MCRCASRRSVGGGPAVDDPHDVSARPSDDAGGCVPQTPTQPFGFGSGEFTVTAQVLEPAHEISRDADELHPCAVGVEVGEREAFEPGVLQSFDVVPRRERGCACARRVRPGCRRRRCSDPSICIANDGNRERCAPWWRCSAAHDQTGPGRPSGEVDEVGDLGDMRSLCAVAAAASGGSPTLVIVGDSADSLVDVGVGTGHDREPDVAGPAPRHESCRATRPSRCAPATWRRTVDASSPLLCPGCNLGG